LPLPLPIADVLQRNRNIEARHGLCPVCKQKDEVEPVPTVVGKELPAPGTLASTLRPPATRSSRLATAAIVFGIFLMVVGVIVAASTSTDDLDREGGNAAAGVVSIIVGLTLAILPLVSIARESKIRTLSRQIWETLCYCHRDRAVFQPETGAWCYPGQFTRFLGRRVGAARRSNS
jgi:hypothetical protein